MYPNPYGLLTNPVRLFGRSRACGMWVSPWVAVNCPVIMDTSQVIMYEHGDRGYLRSFGTEEYRKRLAGPDVMPSNVVLVIIHPKTHMDLMLLDNYRELDGPSLAAKMIDDACANEPGLASRIGWTLFGGSMDGTSSDVAK